MIIAGVPAFEIRELMRKAGDMAILAAFAQEALGISASRTRAVMKDLTAQGYLTSGEIAGEVHWEVTIQGRALAMAKAGAPIKRRTADRLVAEFLQRVEQVNASKIYAYRVARVVAFGSYVTDRPDLGDIDLAISLAAKWRATAWPAEGSYEGWTQPRRDAATNAGRQFSSTVDFIDWPSTEIRLFLKNRSRAISLADADRIPPGAQTKILYQRGRVMRGVVARRTGGRGG
jgi:hypothetical protein